MAKYRFDQIAINSTEKKKPVEEDRFTYLGLEHLDSGSLKVTRFGSEVAPIGEKLVMHKGDVLFGKRRAYQKKVAIAPFDGIFSAHGMVLRPKEDVIDKSFFPLFISSDYFLDATIKISVGSLSPTINWRDLKELEFDLPDMDTQRKLAEVLWSINDTMEAYKKLISATDELVKSQFMEQFVIEKNWPTVTLADAFSLQMGKTPSRDVSEYWDSPDYRWISIADLSNYGNFTEDTKEKISQSAVDNTGIKPVPKETVIMSFKLTIGRTAITSEDIFTNEAIMAFLPKQTDIDIEFLRLYLSIKDWSDDAKRAVKGVTLNKQSIGAAEIVVPPIDEQRAFAAFVRQSDKSKFAVLSCSNLNLWSSLVIPEATQRGTQSGHYQR